MQKKKQHPVRNVVKHKPEPAPAKAEPIETIVAPPVAESVATEAPAAPAVPAGSLVDEVQSFLSRRSELAAKLAEEIDATEKKLAELRKTAALLAPDSRPPVAKEKPKVKKVKKAAPRDEAAADESVTPETPAE